MSNELIIQERAVTNAPAAPPQSRNLLATIADVALNPDVSVEKMAGLIELQIRIQSEEAKVAYNQALHRLQRQVPRIAKNGQIINHKTNQVQSRYAKLEDIDAAVRPSMEAEGFCITYDAKLLPDGKMEISATLSHVMGHSVTKSIPLGIDSSGSKNTTQGMASTVSYGRRHLLKMHLNLIEEGEDNDGQGEMLSSQQQKAICDRIEKTGGDLSRFLAWAQVAELADIPARKFQQCLETIEQVAAARAQRGAQR